MEGIVSLTFPHHSFITEGSWGRNSKHLKFEDKNSKSSCGGMLLTDFLRLISSIYPGLHLQGGTNPSEIGCPIFISDQATDMPIGN